MMPLLLGAALAAPPPFQHVDQVDSYRGCTILIGAQPTGGGVAPLRAVCHWEEVSLDDLYRVLSQYEQYGDFIECMAEVEIVRTEGNRVLVWQLDRLGRGLAPRESQTWMVERRVPGGFQITWETADEPFEADPGSIVTPRNQGFWYVTEADDGGVDIIEQVDIDPGGAIPIWVVNWFQTFATAAQLMSLHDLALGAS